MKCRYTFADGRACERAAVTGHTMCARHYSAGRCMAQERMARAAHLSRGPWKLTVAQKCAIVRAYIRGEPVRDIAARYGISANVASYHALKRGVRRQRFHNGGLAMKHAKELEAVERLRDYDHAFLTPQGVEAFAKEFGLAGKIKPYLARANPKDPKGLTLDNGAKSAMGMDAMVLAMSICNKLHVPYQEMFGRGSQLRACCDALQRHYGGSDEEV